MYIPRSIYKLEHPRARGEGCGTSLCCGVLAEGYTWPNIGIISQNT
jgi:hypothetical protein